VESLVHLNDCEGVELSNTYTLVPGWTVLYGDNVAVADSDVPGNSALKIAKRLGVSVIVGHTRRLGKGTYIVTNADGVSYTVTGVEIGNLVDHRHMEKNGHSRQWQQGFAILETDGSSVSAECIPLSANRAAVRWAGHPQACDALENSCMRNRSVVSDGTELRPVDQPRAG
jgi:predicted RecA/RadA family phage recombinase